MANTSEDSLNPHNSNSTANPTDICRVGVKIRVRVKGVKRISIDPRRDHYAIEEIFTNVNISMTELDK